MLIGFAFRMAAPRHIDTATKIESPSLADIRQGSLQRTELDDAFATSRADPVGEIELAVITGDSSDGEHL